jgi:hypothetical protein
MCFKKRNSDEKRNFIKWTAQLETIRIPIDSLMIDSRKVRASVHQWIILKKREMTFT